MNFLHTIDLSDADDFIAFLKDNSTALCVTLKPKPSDDKTFPDKYEIYGHFADYCKRNQIDYYFQKEVAGQVHYHGIMNFPTQKQRKNFQKWYNRNYGFFNVSDRSGDLMNWYLYVHKDVPEYYQEESNELTIL